MPIRMKFFREQERIGEGRRRWGKGRQGRRREKGIREGRRERTDEGRGGEELRRKRRKEKA